MMRKSTLVLMIVISGLMFYIGCDGGGDRPPRGCPCDFSSIPLTAECWVIDSEPARFTLTITDPSVIIACDLLAGPPELLAPGAFVITTSLPPDNPPECVIFGLNSDTCSAPDFDAAIGGRQIDDCLTDLEQYATELNDAGIPVTNGPPYICEAP